MSPTRSESLFLSLDVDAEAAKRFEDDISLILGRKTPGGEKGDTIHVYWTLGIDYFGEVEEKLKAFRRLMVNPAFIAKADAKEFVHGYSLIVEVAHEIKSIIQQLEQGQS